MSSFKTTIEASLPGVLETNTKQAKYWKANLLPPTVYKELSAINFVDLRGGNEVLATASSRIALYDILSFQEKKTFSSSDSVKLYSAIFREDNSQIFLSGADDGLVRVWDSKKSKPLRFLGRSERSQEQKHVAAVHRVNWNGIHQAFSLGDDRHIKLWDITEDAVVSEFGANDSTPHTDYIRASCHMKKINSLVSGSYDHTVKVWDYRSPEKCTINFDHGAPVESVTYRDCMVITAGDNYIKLFDIIAGKEFQVIKNVHNKTITSVHNHNKYLLSASIDGHLKIYDMNYAIATSISYVPSQILSCAFNGELLAVGMSDGILSVNQMKSKMKTPKIQDNDDPMDCLNSLFTDGPNPQKRLAIDDATTVVAAAKKVARLPKEEEKLKKFQHSAALSYVLKAHGAKAPNKVVDFLQELIRRDALHKALAGRMDRDVKKVIRFVCDHIGDVRYSRILIDVANALIEIYIGQINRSSVLQSFFKRLLASIDREISDFQTLSEITGSFEMVINSTD